MKIGELAAQTGVSVDTIRYYERRGVLPPPARRPSGYRVYGPSAVARINMAKKLQGLGFTLDEVIDALHAIDSGNAACRDQRWRLEAVVQRLDEQIATLRRERRHIVSILRACDAGNCCFVDA